MKHQILRHYCKILKKNKASYFITDYLAVWDSGLSMLLGTDVENITLTMSIK